MSTSHAFLLAPLLFLFSCTNGQTPGAGATLPAKEFQQKMAELPSAPLLDVRTPEEFLKGHLAHALNWNWTDGQFKQMVGELDPSKPVFVYCLSGGRSGAAVGMLQSKGFTQVYELQGGIMKWNAANLPVEIAEGAKAPGGMSKADFEALYDKDKVVLVDFYADWCAPCKRMKPYLDEISKDMADKVTVVRVDADANPALCKELGVDALPVLHVYKGKRLTWQNTGYIGKDAVVQQL
ncbi:MAG: thioredoxin [Flavobacteriales bacterium]|nr:thioredoxin [Flavobacteriales bacterium]